MTLRRKTIPIKTKRERGMLIRGRMIRAEKKRKTMSEMLSNISPFFDTVPLFLAT